VDSPHDRLFDSEFLKKLEQLQLLAKRLFRGEQRAERRSRQIGSSLEFADYREYTPGDELRNVDWPAYGRSERLFIKLYEHEQDLPVSFLVDASASMRWRPAAEAPSTPSKFEHSLRLTAALSYIALANLDAINVHFFADGLLEEFGVTRGKGQFHRVLAFLADAPPPSRMSALAETARAFTQRMKRRGPVFVLSDFLDPAGYQEAISLLRHAQFEVHLLQVLHPGELDPSETGDLRLVDIESDRAIDVTTNAVLLKRYRAEVDAFNTGLERFCRERAITFQRTLVTEPFEEVVLKTLRDGLLLK
jgi:uncharacterized protein (DUF58 family)